MLDSGAQLSIVDQVSLVNMEIGYTQSHGQVQGLDSNPVGVCGGATVTIDVGDGQSVSQELKCYEDYPIANTRGGSAISRATVAHLMSQGDNSNVEAK